MKIKIPLLLALATVQSSHLAAQVQASQEPFHPIVFENKYIRILDVLLPPGDTTQFHIHSTPSLFVYFTNTNVALQIKGKDWIKSRTVSGNTRYTAYTPDTPLIHRVTNLDSFPFHVNDIEILSSYTNKSQAKALGFPLVFENEKSFAYQLKNEDLKGDVVKSHGPLIIELVAGDNVFINYLMKNQSTQVKAGNFLYIEPDIPFNISTNGTSKINLIIFEIK